MKKNLLSRFYLSWLKLSFSHLQREDINTKIPRHNSLDLDQSVSKSRREQQHAVGWAALPSSSQSTLTDYDFRMTVDFDLILPDVGEYGTYQKLMVWFVFLPGKFYSFFFKLNQIVVCRIYYSMMRTNIMQGWSLAAFTPITSCSWPLSPSSAASFPNSMLQIPTAISLTNSSATWRTYILLLLLLFYYYYSRARHTSFKCHFS